MTTEYKQTEATELLRDLQKEYDILSRSIPSPGLAGILSLITRHFAPLLARNAELEKECQQLKFDNGIKTQRLNSAKEYEKDRHKFFCAALETVGMKGEVGSLAGLERKIVERIATLTAQLEELQNDRRVKREAIKCWQRHSAEVAEALGCYSTTDAIIDRVKQLAAQLEGIKPAKDHAPNSKAELVSQVLALRTQLEAAKGAIASLYNIVSTADTCADTEKVGFMDGAIENGRNALTACAAAGLKTEGGR